MLHLDRGMSLNAIIDTLLPGDSELGMPNASSIDFYKYLRVNGATNLIIEFMDKFDLICMKKFKKKFFELNYHQKFEAIDAIKKSNIKKFFEFIEHLMRAYYSDPAVLGLIGAGSQPPFPLGNDLIEDDWTLLECVYERGIAYRILR